MEVDKHERLGLGLGRQREGLQRRYLGWGRSRPGK